ncbi:MAG: CBS domain-containing protein [Alphaproteobacteria bacterium]
MRIKEILEKRNSLLLSVDPDTGLRAAATLMAEHAISALVVKTPDGTLAGILTERDIARHFAREDATTDVRVAAVMTLDVITCTPDHDVSEIADIMSESNIRHLPIIRKGKPVDIVSIRDIVRFHISALQSENRTLRELVAALD